MDFVFVILMVGGTLINLGILGLCLKLYAECLKDVSQKNRH